MSATTLALLRHNTHNQSMSAPSEASGYNPAPEILTLAGWLGSEVEPADFPSTQIRFRNQRAAQAIGLGDVSDTEWQSHFGRFEPLPNNLPQPLALKYHGHQFRVYNPEIGDGRGFLFAQMRDSSGRLLDLGTKGSGQTPYSRSGDGRLTLKGAVREIMATELLEALGVNTSKTFSVIETGEELWRDDEPSPARSAVMTRLSHSHIRIGTFQRLLALEETEQMRSLVDYCLTQFPGPLPPEDAPARDEPAIILMHQVVERLADLAASYMVAGFVHGVLNTDNMNITGESFDYGPWRWLPRWEPGFTAAYFDQGGLYAFGRQPEALHWNCGQLAVALRLLADSDPLIAALNRFGDLYMRAISRRWCWRLGVISRGLDEDTQMIAACEAHMRESKESPDHFFFNARGGPQTWQVKAEDGLQDALRDYEPLDQGKDPYWHAEGPQSLLIEEVEAIWSAIDERDDWDPLERKIAAIRAAGTAHGTAPSPLGHL